MDFREILEKKMNEITSSESSYPQGKRPISVEFHIPISQVKTPVSPLKPNSVPYKNSPRTQWSPDHLDGSVAKAFRFFHTHGAWYLTDKSSERLFKRAFRQLAKSLHPDSEQDSDRIAQKTDIFRELKSHQAVLESFFSTVYRSSYT